MRQRRPQIGAPFKVPSYLTHPLVVPSIRFHTLVPNAYDAPSLHSVASGMLPCFAQSLGGCSLASLSHWRDAPSLCSVTGGMLPHFAQLLGGCSLALLSHWGDAPSLHSVTGGCSLASLSHWGDAPLLCSVAFHSMVPSNCSKIYILEGQ